MPFKYGILNINSEIEYEKMEINYNYGELEKYYKNREDHIEKFLNHATEKARFNNIDITFGIPDKLFIICYAQYMYEIEKKKDI